MMEVLEKLVQPVATRADLEHELFAILRVLKAELDPRRTEHAISLESRLDRDIGIDSLGRAELMMRIERTFQVRLPIETVGAADSVRDLLEALRQAKVGESPAHVAGPAPVVLPFVPAASDAKTLIEVLEWHVAHHPDRMHLTILQDDVVSLRTMSFGDLAKESRAVAAGLISRDINPGDRVALMLPTGSDFFVGFFGILYAGAIPVPIYPPTRISQIEEHMRRQAGILRNAGARILITVSEALRLGALLQSHVPTMLAVATVQTLSTPESQLDVTPVKDSSAIGLIQYTSGSTGDPKGVVLSHTNLLANIRAMGNAMSASSSDVFVSWLPLYHDMGLIGAWLSCLYFGAPFYVMSPLTFLLRPKCWLWAMHRYRATISAAPNFAFELCLKNIDDADIDGLDLGALRLVANGSEPVSAVTMRKFVEKFEHYGFRATAMAPAYGLAENAVGLSLPPLGRAPIVDRVNRDALSRSGIANPALPNDTNAIEIVGCGHVLPEHDLRIIDDLGREVGERMEGQLEFRGPSATSGYFQDEVRTKKLFDGEWVTTGDRAYIAGGDVFITGRIKDIIVRGGRKIYPQEIEEAVGEIPGVVKGGVAAFGASDPGSGTERLIIVAETGEKSPSVAASLRERAHQIATDIVGTPPDEIVLVPPETIPKTASGKIRRAAAKDLYSAQRLISPRRAPRWQLFRLWVSGVGQSALRLARMIGDLLYAAWWWSVVVLGCALGWIVIMTLPRLDWRWAAVRRLAQAALILLRIPVSVRGLERLSGAHGLLLLNHASYADALILAAVLPGEPIFVGKKEFENQRFAGPLMRRLGVAFVERYDMAGSLADTQSVIELARRGGLLVIFPEGTFTRRIGLSGFHLGAFKIASEANLVVYPGAIRGTRSMLRGEQWFPRWSPLSVEISEAKMPSGTDFTSVLKLRDLVRQEILARCGEPDIGGLTNPPRP